MPTAELLLQHRATFETVVYWRNEKWHSLDIIGKRNDVDMLQLLIKHGMSFDNAPAYALDETVPAGNVQFIEALSSAGVIPNPTNQYLLRLAIKHNHPRVLAALLKWGIEPTTYSCGEALLHCYLDPETCSQYLKPLLETGIDPDLFIFEGKPSLCHAAAEGNVAAVEVLLDYGANAANCNALCLSLESAHLLHLAGEFQSSHDYCCHGCGQVTVS